MEHTTATVEPSTVEPATDTNQHNPADALQPGEVVNVELRGAAVGYGATDALVFEAVDDAGERVYIHIPRRIKNLHIARSVPADGVPQPGEVWITQTGTRLFAFQNGTAANRTTCLMDATTGTGRRWHEVHTGDGGPIRRLASVDEIGSWS